MRVASLIAIFVFAGGAIGGVVTVALLLGWSLLFSGHFEWRYVGQFLILLPIGALAGVVLGCPSAVLTSLAYALGPPRIRRSVEIAGVGAITSALASFLAMLVMNWTSPLSFLLVTPLVFAVSGAVAAWGCRRIATGTGAIAEH